LVQILDVDVRIVNVIIVKVVKEDKADGRFKKQRGSDDSDDCQTG
jgi:hypothetical protein